MDFLSNASFQLIILPILIFISRIFDVTLGTIRIIFVAKGMKILAPLIGFFEVLIWLIAMGQIMKNLTNPINYLAYAGGFAAGNFVGIYMENKLAMGIMLLRIITKKKAKELIQFFRADGYQVTNVSAESNDGLVEIIFLPIRRKELPAIIDMIKTFNPAAMYTIEEVRALSSGAIPYQTNRINKVPFRRLFRFKRKGK